MTGAKPRNANEKVYNRQFAFRAFYQVGNIFFYFSNRAAQTTRKWAAALQMVEEKAKIILSRPEFTTLCYYTEEYSARHMTVEAFVEVMADLLNTPDKVN